MMMPPKDSTHIVIAGADPAGVFAALSAARQESAKVTLLTSADQILPTWRSDNAIAHGVTREIWDPAELAEQLVAGEKEMIGPFTRYGPGDFEAWAEAQGLTVEVDADGAVRLDQTTAGLALFLNTQLQAQNVNILTKATLRAVDVKSTGGFWLTLTDERTIPGRLPDHCGQRFDQQSPRPRHCQPRSYLD